LQLEPRACIPRHAAVERRLGGDGVAGGALGGDGGPCGALGDGGPGWALGGDGGKGWRGPQPTQSVLYAHSVISELEPPSSQSAQKHVSKQMSLPGVDQGGELVVGSGSDCRMPQSMSYWQSGYSAPGPPLSQQPSKASAGIPMRVTLLVQRAEGAADARGVDTGGGGGLDTGGCEGESAVVVVLSECTCRRDIAASIARPSALSESTAWRGHAMRRVEAGVATRDGHRRPLGNEGAVMGGPCRLRAPGSHSCSRVIARTASGSSCVAPWPAAAEALLFS
jgi:hypothetical protein